VCFKRKSPANKPGSSVGRFGNLLLVLLTRFVGLATLLASLTAALLLLAWLLVLATFLLPAALLLLAALATLIGIVHAKVSSVVDVGSNSGVH
jgi:hypothetical protein